LDCIKLQYEGDDDSCPSALIFSRRKECRPTSEFVAAGAAGPEDDEIEGGYVDGLATRREFAKHLSFYSLGRCIGKGATSTVYEVTRRYRGSSSLSHHGGDTPLLTVNQLKKSEQCFVTNSSSGNSSSGNSSSGNSSSSSSSSSRVDT
jgi:hypothetical protein